MRLHRPAQHPPPRYARPARAPPQGLARCKDMAPIADKAQTEAAQ
jgi:hypothetical protein